MQVSHREAPKCSKQCQDREPLVHGDLPSLRTDFPEEVVPEITPDRCLVFPKASHGLRRPVPTGSNGPDRSSGFSVYSPGQSAFSRVNLQRARRATPPKPQVEYGRCSMSLKRARRHATPPVPSPEVLGQERKCKPIAAGSGFAMVGGGGMGGGLLENANPLIYERSGERPVTAGEEDEQVPDSIDAREIFDIRQCRARAGSRGPGGGAEVMMSSS